MGELVPFRKRPGAVERMAEVGPGGAEILFFLGVRYEPYIEPRQSGETNGPKTRGNGAGKTSGRGRGAMSAFPEKPDLVPRFTGTAGKAV